MDDATLLQKFLTDRCDEAFAELVRRYVDLVRSAARRQTNDADLAEDVTQAVFVTLAQKANSIRAGEALGGWLLVTTRYSALNAVRAKARRTHHERKAAAMNREEKNGADPSWESMSPLLDEAVARLKREDRDALALRFFEGRSIADVGTAMGISKEAAQKRLTRAVQRLRDIFAARGLATTEDAIGSLLSANALLAAPSALKTAITAQAFAHVATPSSLATSKGVVALMAAANTKIIAVSAAAIVLLGVVGTVAYQSFTTPSGKGHQMKIDLAVQTDAARTASPAVPTMPPMPESQWLPRFKEVYALASGQNVKFIPRPFIPERTNFYRQAFGEQQFAAIPAGPDLMMLDYDGVKFEQEGATFGGSGDPGEAAHYVLDIKPWDLVRLMRVSVSGDWVVRKGTTPNQRIADFLAQIQTATHYPATLERTIVPRPAVIIRGKFEAHPLRPQEDGSDVIVFYRGSDSPAKTDGGGGTLNDRISELSSMPTIDESGSVLPRVEIRISPACWHMKRSDKKFDGQVREMLMNLAKQTSQTYTIETRMLPRWTLAIGMKTPSTGAASQPTSQAMTTLHSTTQPASAP